MKVFWRSKKRRFSGDILASFDKRLRLNFINLKASCRSASVSPSPIFPIPMLVPEDAATPPAMISEFYLNATLGVKLNAIVRFLMFSELNLFMFYGSDASFLYLESLGV